MGTFWKEVSLRAVLLLLCVGCAAGRELKCVCEEDERIYRHGGRTGGRPSGPLGVRTDGKRERVLGKPDDAAQPADHGSPGVRGKKLRSSGWRVARKAHKIGVVGQIVGGRNNGLPAFTAVRSRDLAAMDGNIVITFDRTTTNVAQDFDASSGVFVCQVSGVYYFTFGMRKAEGTDTAVYLMHNGEPVAMAHSTGRAGTETLGQSAVIVLQAKDRVHTELRIGSALDGRRNEPAIVFSGFLIQRK